MTYEQFPEAVGEDVHAEWVNGEAVLISHMAGTDRIPALCPLG